MKIPLRSRTYTSTDDKTLTAWHKRLRHVKIVLFDWDGTLNRDDLKHFAAKKDLIRKFSFDNSLGLTAGSLLRFDGVDPDVLNGSHARKVGWQYFRERFPQIGMIKRFFIYLYYEFTYSQNSTKYDFLYSGGAETLRQLHNKGYILGVATNKGSNIVKKQRTVSGFDGVFISILGSDSVLRMKPEPDMILKNLGIINRKMNADYKPRNILMVGDSVTSDVKAGLNAGCFTCLVHAPESGLKEVESNNLPHLNLKSINQLPEFLP